jgi:hypothetical protein
VIYLVFLPFCLLNFSRWFLPCAVLSSHHTGPCSSLTGTQLAHQAPTIFMHHRIGVPPARQTNCDASAAPRRRNFRAPHHLPPILPGVVGCDLEERVVVWRDMPVEGGCTTIPHYACDMPVGGGCTAVLHYGYHSCCLPFLRAVLLVASYLASRRNVQQRGYETIVLLYRRISEQG